MVVLQIRNIRNLLLSFFHLGGVFFLQVTFASESQKIVSRRILWKEKMVISRKKYQNNSMESKDDNFAGNSVPFLIILIFFYYYCCCYYLLCLSIHALVFFYCFEVMIFLLSLYLQSVLAKVKIMSPRRVLLK